MAVSTASGSKPAFAGSSATLTWSRIGNLVPGRTSPAIRSSRRASSSESTDWITSTASSARRALFAWSGPTRCQRPPCVPSTFSTASWTRFSPSSVSPASIAACTTSTGCVFDTATSVTSDASRPTRAAASPIRPSTTSRARTNSATRSAVMRNPGHRQLLTRAAPGSVRGKAPPSTRASALAGA